MSANSAWNMPAASEPPAARTIDPLTLDSKGEPIGPALCEAASRISGAVYCLYFRQSPASGCELIASSSPSSHPTNGNEAAALAARAAAERVAQKGQAWTGPQLAALPVGSALPCDVLVICSSSGVGQARGILEQARPLAALATLARDAIQRETAVAARLTELDQTGLSVRVQPLAETLRDAERLRRTERLASIGTLAAGIAHELNNPLGAIMLEAETAALAARRKEPDPLLASSLEGIRHNIDRCSRIIKGILRFAKHEHGEHVPCDLAAVLRRARDYTRELAAQRHVSVDLGALPAGLAVVGNELALEQVFVNLFNNALEASPPGSVVEVRAHDDPAALRVTVSDRGPGIPAAEIQRVFDPFFTTRQQAAGTGLGLSIVQGIVADHQGEVEVSSQVGQGAVFTVSLPRMQDP